MIDFRPITNYNIKLGIGQCVAMPGYKLGIAVPVMHQCDLYFDQIVNDFLDQNFINRKTRYRVELKNKSSIEVFLASDTARGKRFHELIISPFINHDVVWNCLAYMFARPYNELEYKEYLKERANYHQIHN